MCLIKQYVIFLLCVVTCSSLRSAPLSPLFDFKTVQSHETAEEFLNKTIQSIFIMEEDKDYGPILSKCFIELLKQYQIQGFQDHNRKVLIWLAHASESIQTKRYVQHPEIQTFTRNIAETCYSKPFIEKKKPSSGRLSTITKSSTKEPEVWMEVNLKCI